MNMARGPRRMTRAAERTLKKAKTGGWFEQEKNVCGVRAGNGSDGWQLRNRRRGACTGAGHRSRRVRPGPARRCARGADAGLGDDRLALGAG
ncbi:protein of unknown function [uncultured Sphingopyxis sp.]|uniref:Uncharacterized protein n=1 Tax=uncultured Sphingopyxis sp. TaxID=310581 RepID=A0A1Y5PY36_9SPHN|nr:protein of unknown function [uncultured Sphingopyxis sp.]